MKWLPSVSTKRATYSLILVCLGLSGCGDGPVGPALTLIPIDSLLAGPLTLTLNPSGIAPLSAELTFKTSTPTSVEVRVLGSVPVEYEGSELVTDHDVPILGLYADRDNAVEIRLADVEGNYGLDTLSIRTDPLPDFLPEIDIVAADTSRMEPGLSFADFSLADNGRFLSFPFAFDHEGEVRWILDLSSLPTMGIGRLANGNLFFGFGDAVYEFDFLGRQLNRWVFPGYIFHHDVIEKPDGNLVVAVTKGSAGTVEDHVIELSRSSGQIVREWDLREVLDIRRREPFGTELDWFHMNSIEYDERDNSLILSGRNQAVVKVSAENELIWILAHHRGWGRAGPDGTGPETSNFLLTAVNADGVEFSEAVQMGDERTPGFDWPWTQHAAVLLPNGNLFLFDNGDHRNFAPSPLFSRGVEYKIDESRKTIRQVWTYGEERGAEYFSRIVSDVDYLPETSNRLIVPGIIFDSNPRAYISEISETDRQVVFEAELLFKNARSTGQFLWGQFDMLYRAERLTLHTTPDVE
jgi:arylsulfate sulfotransferase